MDYQKAWAKLKESLIHDSKNGHNSMTSMSEGTWTEVISGNIVKKMNRLEEEMLSDSGFIVTEDKELKE